MKRDDNETQIKDRIKLIQNNKIPAYVREDNIINILEQFKPFRHSLARKFANKGVEFDDICQQIDLKMIEAMYDYEEILDPSAIRHITSKARNGIWNFYRKEMDYFDDDRKTISLDGSELGGEGIHILHDSNTFDEDAIVDRVIIEQELESLTEHQKDILLMYYIGEMKQDEIARELNIHQTNVSRATKRGIKRLKDSLNP